MIWCVDDDSTIRDIEVYTLNATGFEARGFADGKALFEALEHEKPKLILLDIMMPGEDGVEILKKLRANPTTKELPVIMATAKGTETDKITGLNLGADAYLVKPFGMMEMVARVKAVLRRCGGDTGQEIVTVGDILLKDKERMVYVNDEKVELTYKEFELLHLFLQNPGIVLTRERLMAEVWGMDYMGETRTIDMHIKTLRKKLREAGRQIHTVIGVGYRMEDE